jgi:hypothetical protein
VAKQAGPRIGPSIPWLIAGISLVDGAVILSCGGGAAAAAFGVVGFALTLLAQRVVPGT